MQLLMNLKLLNRLDKNIFLNMENPNREKPWKKLHYN